jgi:hypothetical protein
MIMSRVSYFHNVKRFADCCRKYETHILFNNFLFSKIVSYMRKFGKTWYRPQCLRWQYNTAHAIARWITKATHTLRIRNNGLPRQQWLQEPPSTLRYAYIAYLVLEIRLTWGAIAIRYGMNGLEFGSSRPDQHWDRTSLLINGYRGCFLGVNRPGQAVDQSPPPSAGI